MFLLIVFIRSFARWLLMVNVIGHSVPAVHSERVEMSDWVGECVGGLIRLYGTKEGPLGLEDD